MLDFCTQPASQERSPRAQITREVSKNSSRSRGVCESKGHFFGHLYAWISQVKH